MSFNSSPVIGKAMKAENVMHTAIATANEKKIFDAVKSLLTLLQHWDENHQTGKVILATIGRLKESTGWKLDNLPPSRKVDALQEACNKLGVVLDKMVGVADDLHTLAQQILLLSSLHQFQSQKTAKLPVFLSGTWDCMKFGAVFQSISHAFYEEIKVLTVIKESVAGAPDKSSVTVYIARWNHSVCSNTKIIMLINGLLLESSYCVV